MSRCTLCDFSQSAPSFYNEGLQLRQSNNRVVHSREHGDICISCLEDIQSASDGYDDPEREFEDANQLEDAELELGDVHDDATEIGL